MPRRAPLCAVCGGGGSHGCKSMPDSVNVSELQPSMERHTSGASSSPNCKKPLHHIIHRVCYYLLLQMMVVVIHLIWSGLNISKSLIMQSVFRVRL